MQICQEMCDMATYGAMWGDMTVDGQVDTEILKNVFTGQRPLPSVFMYSIYVCKSSKLLYDHLD